MTALATRPEDLRLAARTMLGAATELRAAGQRARQAEAESATGWQGVAALAQRLATQRVAAAALARSAPAQQVAGALGVLADQAEQAQMTVRAEKECRDRATAERVRQITLLGTVTDPQQIEVIRGRIVRLEREISRCEDEISWAEEQLQRGRDALERMLRDSWIGWGVEELKDLVDLGRQVAPIWRGGGLVIVGVRVLLTTRKLARELTPFARIELENKLQRLLKVLRKPPIFFVLTRLTFRVLIPLTVIPDAFEDLRTGGGYEGVQGFALRASAAVAIPGSIAMVLPHPMVAGLGAVSVGIYYLAKSGYAIWDHRLFLTQVAVDIHQHRHKIIQKAAEVLRPTPPLPLGPLGPLYPVIPGAGLLHDLPRLSHVGRLLPWVEAPLSVPDVPIEAGVRLPVIPSPSLGPAGLGVLVPSLGKLF